MGFRNTPEAERKYEDITYYVRENINLDEHTYNRLAIQTHFVNRGESYVELVRKYVLPLYSEGDILSISEKIISMCQNNIVEKKDVKLGFWAKFLSKFASSNNHGIAMDEPYKLQLAINIAGLGRILFASVCSAIGKIFGKRGIFYKIAGNGIDGIDGFYMGSSFDLYHDIALLNPKDPVKVCNEIFDELKINCMIVDANDLSINIFGKSDSLKDMDNKKLIALIKDNPAGQSDELTPLILIKKLETEELSNKKDYNLTKPEEIPQEELDKEVAKINKNESDETDNQEQKKIEK